MAGIEQRIIVGFDPKDLDRLKRAITDAVKDGHMTVMPAGNDLEIKPMVEPITITVPTEARKDKATPQETKTLCLFFDSKNQEHWVTQEVGDVLGYRQAFFLPQEP